MSAMLAALVTTGILASSIANAQQVKADYCGNAPTVVELIAPTADANPELRRYEGVWSGKWGSGTCNVIVVTGITKTSAQIHYFYGRGVNVPQPGNWKREAGLKNGSLWIKSQLNEIWYQLQADGSMRGSYNQTADGRLQRVPAQLAGN